MMWVDFVMILISGHISLPVRSTGNTVCTNQPVVSFYKQHVSCCFKFQMTFVEND